MNTRHEYRRPRTIPAWALPTTAAVALAVGFAAGAVIQPMTVVEASDTTVQDCLLAVSSQDTVNLNLAHKVRASLDVAHGYETGDLAVVDAGLDELDWFTGQIDKHQVVYEEAREQCVHGEF